MSSIKGKAAYWRKFMKDVMAMIRLLRIPVFFLTFLCADLRWRKLVCIIRKRNGMEIPDEKISKLNYQERYNILNSFPVPVARHFQYLVELFFKL